jgi:hypothetical protein
MRQSINILIRQQGHSAIPENSPFPEDNPPPQVLHTYCIADQFQQLMPTAANSPINKFTI